MAWSGGNFTRANPTWATDASLGIGIEAGRHDAQDNDFTTGIDQCLNKTGQNSMTGDLNLGGYKAVNAAAGTAAAPAICAGNDVNTGIFGPAADTVAVATNGTERMRIDSSGRVGIGTTSPGFLLDAQLTSANAAAFQRFAATGDGPFVTLIKSRSGTVGTYTIVSAGDTLGTIAWGGANGTSYNDAAYIRGIVDNTPGASNDMPGRLEFCTTPDGSGLPLERMRITSNGFVGINTAGGGGQLQVNSNSTTFPVLDLRTNAAGDVANSAIEIIKTDNNTTSSQNFIRFYINANTGSGRIVANGASAAAFATYSDERLKENIEDLPSQLDNILSLRPVEFDYKNGSGHQIGFIAQEVEQIYPDLVGEDGEYLVLADLNKNDARLIKAFQELAAKVEALEAKVQALEAVTEV